jgi:plastocyanin
MSALNADRPRRWLAPALVLGCILILLLAGCGSSPSASTGPAPTATVVPPAPTATTAPTAAPTPTTGTSGNQAAVTILSFAFHPQSITIKVGTTVTWTDNDSVAHTVTSLSGPASFNSGPLGGPGGTFHFTFTKAGTYNYHCMIHPSMMASITVTS